MPANTIYEWTRHNFQNKLLSYKKMGNGTSSLRRKDQQTLAEVSNGLIHEDMLILWARMS